MMDPVPAISVVAPVVIKFSTLDESGMIAYLTGKKERSEAGHVIFYDDSKAKRPAARPIPLIRQNLLPEVSKKTIHMIYLADDRVIDCGVSDWMNLPAGDQIKLLGADADVDPILNKAVEIRKPFLDAAAKFSYALTGRMPDPANKAVLAMSLEFSKEWQEKSALNPSMPGSMRSWHQNDAGYLPQIECDPAALVGKARNYQRYIETMKGLTNKQREKNVPVVYTGYAEYTAGGWSSTRGRIVYDYVNEIFFFSPSHYSPWDEESSPWFKVVTSL